MKRRVALALAAVAGAFLLTAPTSFGAVTTKTLTFPLSGNSTTNIFNEPFECCHISFSVDPFGSFDGDISGGIALDMKTTMAAPTHNDLTFTDTNLRQGSHLDLTNTFNSDPGGSFNADYTLSGNLDLYGFNFNYSQSASDTLSCALPLTTDTCSHTKNIPLFNFTLIDVGVAYFNVNVDAPITTTAKINGDGVTSHRTMTVSSIDALPPGDLNFTSSPQAKDEGTNLSCSLPAGQPVNYAMGAASSHVKGTVNEGVSIGVGGTVFLRALVTDVDILDVGPFTFGPLFTLPDRAFNTIDLTAPAQNVDLGNLLPNLTPPTVAMDTIPTNGTEGNPIQLSVKGTGPGGSLSPCGDDSLDIKWTFDDGGTATGKTVSHTFAENFLGGVPHTGTVVITDPTGLTTTLPFMVPVADAPISLSCATPSVSLQAFNGTVANLADGDPAAPLTDFTATINWGDSSSSSGTVSGSGGSYSVAGSHTYASTGYFNVSVHVDDVGGNSADTTTPCTLLVFAFPPGGGSFVIGDKSSANGTAVTYWGAQWAKQNSLSGGGAPSSFKGFAKSPTTPSCFAPLEHRPGQQLLAAGGTAARLHGRDRRGLGHAVRLADLGHDGAHRRRANGNGLRAQSGARRHRDRDRPGLLSERLNRAGRDFVPSRRSW